MKKIMWIALLILPITIASVLPSNCDAFEGEKRMDCQSILADFSLSLSEKEDLYLNLVHAQTELGSFDFAYEWNKNISNQTAPDTTQENGIIRDAWIKIIGVNNSFFDRDSNQWKIAPTGKIATASNYSIVLPTDILPEECNTTYTYTVLEDQFRVYLNTLLIGTDQENQYLLSNENDLPANFQAEQHLRVQLQIHHFHLVQFNRNGPWTCVWNYTTREEYKTLATDTFTAKTIQNIVYNSQKYVPVTGGYKIFARLTRVHPINRYKLELGENSFSFSETDFDLNAQKTVFVTRTNRDTNQTNGLIIQDFKKNNEHVSFSVFSEKIVPCNLTITTDFNETAQPCEIEPLKQTGLRLSSDKNFVDQNENIRITAQLLDDRNKPIPNQSVKIEERLADTNASGEAQIELTAKETHGIINAEFAQTDEYASSHAIQRITLTDSETHQTGFNLLVFFGVYFAVYLVAKKKAGAI